MCIRSLIESVSMRENEVIIKIKEKCLNKDLKVETQKSEATFRSFFWNFLSEIMCKLNQVGSKLLRC